MTARVLKADRRGPLVVPAAIHDARAEASAILARAHDDAERVRERAREAGRSEGRAEVAATLLRVADARDRMLGELEAQAVDVAMLAAGHIVGDALSAHPERITGIVRPLLTRLRRARQVTLRVHPDDRAALAASLPTLAREAELACAIAIEPDASIARGGCVVTSDAGVLDARLEVRLEALRDALGKR